MVFENVTLFEVHLDDVQFGRESGRSDKDSRTESTRAARRGARRDRSAVRTASGDDGDDSADDGDSGRGRFAKLAVASAVVSVVATLVARRLAGHADPDFDVNGPDGLDSESRVTDATGEGGRTAGPSAAGDH